MLLVRLVALAICSIGFVRMYRAWQSSRIKPVGLLAFCVSAVGLLGFVEAAWIDLFPAEFLSCFELPNDPFQGVHLTAPDGRVFIISPAIARVQRYGADGFELGFMYQRKAFRFGMSGSGNLSICATAGELLTYSPDGEEVLPRGSCRDRFEVPSSYYSSQAHVPTISFNWFSALAVPLWHPVAGWAFILLGGLLFWLGSPTKRDAP
jgi:hypothetical protein